MDTIQKRRRKKTDALSNNGEKSVVSKMSNTSLQDLRCTTLQYKKSINTKLQNKVKNINIVKNLTQMDKDAKTTSTMEMKLTGDEIENEDVEDDDNDIIDIYIDDKDNIVKLDSDIEQKKGHNDKTRINYESENVDDSKDSVEKSFIESELKKEDSLLLETEENNKDYVEIPGKDIDGASFTRIVLIGDSFLSFYCKFWPLESKLKPFFLYKNKLSCDELFIKFHEHEFLKNSEKILIIFVLSLHDFATYGTHVNKSCTGNHSQIEYVENLKAVKGYVKKLSDIKDKFSVNENISILFSYFPPLHNIKLLKDIFDWPKTEVLNCGCTTKDRWSSLNNSVNTDFTAITQIYQRNIIMDQLNFIRDIGILEFMLPPISFVNGLWKLTKEGEESKKDILVLNHILNEFIFKVDCVDQSDIADIKEQFLSMRERIFQRKYRIALTGDKWIYSVARQWPGNFYGYPSFYTTENFTFSDLRKAILSLVKGNEVGIVITSIPAGELLSIKSSSKCIDHRCLEYPVPNEQILKDPVNYAHQLIEKMNNLLLEMKELRPSCRILYMTSYPMNFSSYYSHLTKIHVNTVGKEMHSDSDSLIDIEFLGFDKKIVQCTDMINQYIQSSSEVQNVPMCNIYQVVNSSREDILFPTYVEGIFPSPLLVKELLKHIKLYVGVCNRLCVNKNLSFCHKKSYLNYVKMSENAGIKNSKRDLDVDHMGEKRIKLSGFPSQTNSSIQKLDIQKNKSPLKNNKYEQNDQSTGAASDNRNSDSKPISSSAQPIINPEDKANSFNDQSSDSAHKHDLQDNQATCTDSTNSPNQLDDRSIVNEDGDKNDILMKQSADDCNKCTLSVKVEDSCDIANAIKQNSAKNRLGRSTVEQISIKNRLGYRSSGTIKANRKSLIGDQPIRPSLLGDGQAGYATKAPKFNFVRNQQSGNVENAKYGLLIDQTTCNINVRRQGLLGDQPLSDSLSYRHGLLGNHPTYCTEDARQNFYNRSSIDVEFPRQGLLGDGPLVDAEVPRHGLLGNSPLDDAEVPRYGLLGDSPLDDAEVPRYGLLGDSPLDDAESSRHGLLGDGPLDVSDLRHVLLGNQPFVEVITSKSGMLGDNSSSVEISRHGLLGDNPSHGLLGNNPSHGLLGDNPSNGDIPKQGLLGDCPSVDGKIKRGLLGDHPQSNSNSKVYPFDDQSLFKSKFPKNDVLSGRHGLLGEQPPGKSRAINYDHVGDCSSLSDKGRSRGLLGDRPSLNMMKSHLSVADLFQTGSQLTNSDVVSLDTRKSSGTKYTPQKNFPKFHSSSSKKLRRKKRSRLMGSNAIQKNSVFTSRDRKLQLKDRQLGKMGNSHASFNDRQMSNIQATNENSLQKKAQANEFNEVARDYQVNSEHKHEQLKDTPSVNTLALKVYRLITNSDLNSKGFPDHIEGSGENKSQILAGSVKDSPVDKDLFSKSCRPITNSSYNESRHASAVDVLNSLSFQDSRSIVEKNNYSKLPDRTQRPSSSSSESKHNASKEKQHKLVQGRSTGDVLRSLASVGDREVARNRANKSEKVPNKNFNSEDSRMDSSSRPNSKERRGTNNVTPSSSTSDRSAAQGRSTGDVLRLLASVGDREVARNHANKSERVPNKNLNFRGSRMDSSTRPNSKERRGTSNLTPSSSTSNRSAAQGRSTDVLRLLASIGDREVARNRANKLEKVPNKDLNFKDSSMDSSSRPNSKERRGTSNATSYSLTSDRSSAYNVKALDGAIGKHQMVDAEIGHNDIRSRYQERRLLSERRLETDFERNWVSNDKEGRVYDSNWRQKSNIERQQGYLNKTFDSLLRDTEKKLFGSFASIGDRQNYDYFKDTIGRSNVLKNRSSSFDSKLESSNENLRSFRNKDNLGYKNEARNDSLEVRPSSDALSSFASIRDRQMINVSDSNTRTYSSQWNRGFNNETRPTSSHFHQPTDIATSRGSIRNQMGNVNHSESLLFDSQRNNDFKTRNEYVPSYARSAESFASVDNGMVNVNNSHSSSFGSLWNNKDLNSGTQHKKDVQPYPTSDVHRSLSSIRDSRMTHLNDSNNDTSSSQWNRFSNETRQSQLEVPSSFDVRKPLDSIGDHQITNAIDSDLGLYSSQRNRDVGRETIQASSENCPPFHAHRPSFSIDGHQMENVSYPGLYGSQWNQGGRGTEQISKVHPPTDTIRSFSTIGNHQMTNANVSDAAYGSQGNKDFCIGSQSADHRQSGLNAGTFYSKDGHVLSNDHSASTNNSSSRDYHFNAPTQSNNFAVPSGATTNRSYETQHALPNNRLAINNFPINEHHQITDIQSNNGGGELSGIQRSSGSSFGTLKASSEYIPVTNTFRSPNVFGDHQLHNKLDHFNSAQENSNPQWNRNVSSDTRYAAPVGHSSGSILKSNPSNSDQGQVTEQFSDPAATTWILR